VLFRSTPHVGTGVLRFTLFVRDFFIYFCHNGISLKILMDGSY